MREQRPLRVLPIEGLPISELVVQGNGKLAWVDAKMVDGRKFRFGVSDFALAIGTRGAVHTEIRAIDDLTLRVRYTAGRLVLTRAQLDYPGSESDWVLDLERFNKGDRMSWGMSTIQFELMGEDVG